MKLRYKFDHALKEAVIRSRPNRFVMLVDLAGSIVKCHCPATGRIGDISFLDIPCLLSVGKNKDRKTSYTVEAISLDPIYKKNKSWIGINQTRVNEYIEFFLRKNQLSKMVKGKKIYREKRLGKSRIDFLIDTTYLEVKMPLISLPIKSNTKIKTHSRFNSFDRLIKHFADLSKNIEEGYRAVVVLCYMYDAKPFLPPKLDRYNLKIQSAVKSAAKKGVENWQVTLKIDARGVSLIKYFKLNLF